MPQPGTLQVSTPTDTTIVITRSFSAPRHLVWDAMTKPELVRRWMFCPPGWTWAECRMDVRADGKFRWAWNGPDGTLALAISGEHREVKPPAKIVHTEHMEMGPGASGSGNDCAGVDFPSVLVTLELEERGDETHMKMTISCPSREVRDAMIASGMDQGMEVGYAALDRLLAGYAASGATRASKITPFLMFNNQLEEAIKFYTELFPDSCITTSTAGPDGAITSAEFVIGHQRLMAYNGGPRFAFTSAFSLYVDCEDQAEVDRYWDRFLEAGGKPSQCGWLTDHFGVSWQIVPRRFRELMSDPDGRKVRAVVGAMLQMSKLDVASLERAHAEA